MNEQIARDVVLVRAIETTDQKLEILSADDRAYASRSAKELAQWQASGSKSAVTSDHFLQQRSEQILKRIAERFPTFSAFAKHRKPLNTVSWTFPVLALLLGIGLDRITDPHRVDLLSAPLLLIIVWNLVVYLSLIVWLCIPSSKRGASGWARKIAVRKIKLPRKLPHTLSAALFSFLGEWTQLSAKVTNARLARTIHFSAAAFAIGAALSLYARGMLSQYAAGWESTFLDATQVHDLLTFVFAPAIAIFPVQGFSVTEIEALRFSPTMTAAGGARWVHLYAATLFLLVVLPRILLGLASHLRVAHLKKKFPLDLEQPYFRKLSETVSAATPAILRVLPYSFTVDEARDKGLTVLGQQMLGQQTRLMLRPSFAYGEDVNDLLKGSNAADEKITTTAVLFNLTATPETENHGAFLDSLVRLAPRGLTVLIDESSYLERMGKERIGERIALWRGFCEFHKAPATFVNLLALPALSVEKDLS